MEVKIDRIRKGTEEFFEEFARKEVQYGRSSGWMCEAGKPTLKPGPDLVGKVWKVWKPEMAF